MSAAFVITSEEWQALAGVDHLACRLYLSLRRCMDFRTGVVGGPHKAVSWQALREDCEVPGRPGVRHFRPTEQMLRRRVDQLEKCGLLRRVSEGLILKFRMLLARTDSCVQKKAGGGARGEKKPKQPNTGADARRLSTSRSLRKADTHPNPGKTSNPSSPSFSYSTEEDERENTPSPPVDAVMREGDATQRHQLSEQRERDADAVGDGPAGQLAEGQHDAEPAWSPVLAWPRRIPLHERAAVAHQLSVLPHGVRQRVLDEWDGAMDTGQILRPWLFFESVVGWASGPGWLPEHADRVAERRKQASAVASLVERQREVPVAVSATPVGSLTVARMRKLVKPRGTR